MKIKRLRGDKSYAEIARAVNCSAPTIREIESDLRKDPSYRLIARLAKYFNVEMDWIMDDKADWPPPTSPQQKAADLVQQALTASGLIGELTEQERTCLAAIRMLPPDRQAEVFGFVKGLAAEAGRYRPGISIPPSLPADLDRAGKAALDVSEALAKLRSNNRPA